MNMKMILSYARFNYWANVILLSLTEKEINDENLDKNIVSSFHSLRETIYHIWGAEWLWFKRLNGESLTEWPSKNFKGTFSEAKEKILENNLAFIDYVKNLSNEEFFKNFTYMNVEGKTFTNPIWQ